VVTTNKTAWCHPEPCKFYFISGGLFSSGHFSENLAALQDLHLSPALLLAAKATLAFPLCYHYANGIRHLVSMHLLDDRQLLQFMNWTHNEI
jgi:hypothetical protein